jgi:hypothetical protein
MGTFGVSASALARFVETELVGIVAAWAELLASCTHPPANGRAAAKPIPRNNLPTMRFFIFLP